MSVYDSPLVLILHVRMQTAMSQAFGDGLPVLPGYDVTLSVAVKGKGTTRTAGNAHTMPHQLDIGPTMIEQCPRCQPKQLL